MAMGKIGDGWDYLKDRPAEVHNPNPVNHKQEATNIVSNLIMDINELLEDCPAEDKVMGKTVYAKDRDWFIALEELKEKANELYSGVFL
jgi:hypothetical protein